MYLLNNDKVQQINNIIFIISVIISEGDAEATGLFVNLMIRLSPKGLLKF